MTIPAALRQPESGSVQVALFVRAGSGHAMSFEGRANKKVLAWLASELQKMCDGHEPGKPIPRDRRVRKWFVPLNKKTRPVWLKAKA